MYKRYKKRQSGSALPFFALSAALPFAKAALPFLRKAALGGAASFGVGKILGKIIGGKRKKEEGEDIKDMQNEKKTICRRTTILFGR